jgi:phosphate transport system permease protein
MTATVLRPPPPPPTGRASTPKRVRRRPRALTSNDLAIIGGSAVSAFAITWLAETRLTAGFGWLGFLLVAYVLFLALFALATSERHGRLVAVDRVVAALVATGAAVLLAPLAWLIGYVLLKGLPVLSLEFLTSDQRGITATDPATEGGASHAIVGSLQQVAMALVLAVPLAVTTAVFLNETRSRLRRPVRIYVDAMSGLPSIVAGLFIFATLIIPYAEKTDLFGYNGFMASLALALIMIPTVARTVEVVLRLVPDGLREASLAMGASRARTVWSVVLPTARSGITTAVVLGIARCVGETAPLLFTAFGYELMNSNPVANPQESLPLFVFRYIRQPSEAAIQRGFAGALVLLLIVLTLFLLARVIGRDRRTHVRRRFRRRHRPRPEPVSP